MSLDDLRAQLDRVDDALVDLLARRASLVEEIWALKAREGIARVDPAREAALRSRLLARASRLGLSERAVESVLAQIVGRPLKK